MFYPTTGLQVASHDAWLDEMNKEPSPEAGQVAKVQVQGGRMGRMVLRLAGVVRWLRSSRLPGAPTAPETPAEATGASF
jgi:hypothetical protein